MSNRIEQRVRARYELENKIKILNETVWEARVGEPTIREWLDNFNGDVLEVEEERLNALFLLSNVTYFGVPEVRGLLKALFRDRYKYPIIRDIRRRHNNTTDEAFLDREFRKELGQTRFVPLGGTAESGQMIAYMFRQENGLSKINFADRDNLIVKRRNISAFGRLLAWLRPAKYYRQRRDAKHIVFVDDFAGTGHQAEQYAGSIVRRVKRIQPDVRTTYLVMATTQAALAYLRSRSVFDAVEAAVVLTDADQCTTSASRIFHNPQVDGINAGDVLAVARGYGAKLLGRGNALGYSGGGWLLSFNHNTPDNTLPIFWYDQKGWQWVLRRHHKY